MVTPLVGAAADANTVRTSGGNTGALALYNNTEVAGSGASLAEAGGVAARKFTPSIANLVTGSSTIANAGKAIGAASKASPYLWAGNMVLQGIDVATNPEKNKQETLALAKKPPLERAIDGFTNPIKTIAGTGQALGELAHLEYENSKYKNSKLPNYITPTPAKTMNNSAAPQASGSPAPTPTPGKAFGKTASVAHVKALLKAAAGAGLWANIRAKRKRGETPAQPGDEHYPDKKQWKKLTTKQAAVELLNKAALSPKVAGGLNSLSRAPKHVQEAWLNNPALHKKMSSRGGRNSAFKNKINKAPEQLKLNLQPKQEPPVTPEEAAAFFKKWREDQAKTAADISKTHLQKLKQIWKTAPDLKQKFIDAATKRIRTSVEANKLQYALGKTADDSQKDLPYSAGLTISKYLRDRQSRQARGFGNPGVWDVQHSPEDEKLVQQVYRHLKDRKKQKLKNKINTMLGGVAGASVGAMPGALHRSVPGAVLGALLGIAPGALIARRLSQRADSRVNSLTEEEAKELIKEKIKSFADTSEANKHPNKAITLMQAASLPSALTGIGALGAMYGVNMPLSEISKEQTAELINNSNLKKKISIHPDVPLYPPNAYFDPENFEVRTSKSLNKPGIIAHELGHANIHEDPGFVGFLQRKVYEPTAKINQYVGAFPLSLASYYATKDDKDPTTGALKGLTIGAVGNAGMLVPEFEASRRGIAALLKSKSLTGKQKLFNSLGLAPAFLTYLAGTAGTQAGVGALNAYWNKKNEAKK